MTNTAPLILTLTLDKRSFAFFDAQRQRYFPPERNHIPAHLTLFHKLPAEQTEVILHDLAAAAANQAPFSLAVDGLRSLGRGVAYTLTSSALRDFRHPLARKWALWLSLQDRQKHQPHITIQNKVDPGAATALLARIRDEFEPFAATAEGLSLWRYLGGPWEPFRSFAFTRAS